MYHTIPVHRSLVLFWLRRTDAAALSPQLDLLPARHRPRPHRGTMFHRCLSFRHPNPRTAMSNESHTLPLQGKGLERGFLFNGIEVRLVPFHGQDTHPETGIAFYVNNGHDGVIGVQVRPDGSLHPTNASYCKYGHTQYSHGTADYLQFRQAWGKDVRILASHAVNSAWNEPQPVDENGKKYQCHHLNGITTDNRFTNLIWLSQSEHRLFDKVQKSLRQCGRDLTQMSRTEIISITRQFHVSDPQDLAEKEPHKYD